MTSYKRILIAVDLKAEPVQVVAKAQSITAASPTSLFLIPPSAHLIPIPVMLASTNDTTMRYWQELSEAENFDPRTEWRKSS